VVIIYLGLPLPTRSCNLPGSHNETGRLILPYLVLLQTGFTKPPASPPTLVSSYLTVSPLPRPESRGGLLSAALSVGSLPLGVTQHPALWSSDFPRVTPERATRDHLTDSRNQHIKIQIYSCNAIITNIRLQLSQKTSRSPPRTSATICGGRRK
jgi:hypothetical protein